MIDFEKMLEEEDQENPINPLEIFQGLIRDEEYEYLRSVQEHVLEAWFTQRDKQDIIVKMNTGNGKTLVGLLMLQSCINEGHGPAIYLCIDNQLVEQVMDEANKCGIRNVTFEDYDIPIEFLNSEAILITTFNKLVNGKSKFGVKGTTREQIPIGSLLVDDAHHCLKKARQAFTISLDRNKSFNVCDRLIDLFRNSLYEQSPGIFKDLEDKAPLTLMTVPYWNWLDSIDEVIEILGDSRNEEGIEFHWDLLRDNLENCSCFISDRIIEITPQCIPIEYIPSFNDAKRRFFLSATLLDDSHLIKEFGISSDAVKNPLKPKISGDMGERMIIMPSLIDSSLDRDKIVKLLATKIQEGFNTVILTPSFVKAEIWTRYGAKKVGKNSIISSIKHLYDHNGNFIVLANRYDGIDLAGNSCRILILDRTPKGESLFEKFINQIRPRSRLLRSTQAQKIEQGLGRGVRSGSDYCVVILIGNDLVGFLSLNENKELLSPQTRVQIEMGLKFGKTLKKEGDSEKAILDLMEKCLDRDTLWMKYHRKMIQKAGESSIELLPIQLAKIEKTAFEYFQLSQYRKASKTIQEILDSTKISLDDKADLGWYIQLAGFYLYKSDPVKSMEIQLKAHRMNTSLPRPPEGVEYQKIQRKMGQQPNKIVKWINKYAEPNSLVLDANVILNYLSFGVKFKKFEEAFANLAEIIGFESQRPEKEYGKGPDILWQLSDGTYLIIPAKDEVTSTRGEISKKYADQLSGSLNWFNNEYSGQVGIPVLIHPYNRLASDAYCTDDAMVLDTNGLKKMVSNVRNFIGALATKSPNSWDDEDVMKLVVQFNLDPGSIKSQYFCKIKK